MGKIADVLAGKGKEVHTVDHETTVFDAVKKMVDKNLGSVIVTSEGEICGIFTERDYLRRIVVEGRASRTTSVHEVMVSRVVYVAPSGSVEDALTIMTQERVRHLPVMEEKALVGIVSIGDLVKYLSKEREIEIRHLTEYIRGDYPL
jgi:CBS domain-containing protein